MARALALLALVWLSSCTLRGLRDPPTRRMVQLLSATTASEEARPLTTEETALLRRRGTRGLLCGDADGTRGWSVRGVVRLEVVGPAGLSAHLTVPADAPAGGLREFGPGEVDITATLPKDHEALFRIRASVDGTAVSDLFLILEPPPAPPPSRALDRAPSF